MAGTTYHYWIRGNTRKLAHSHCHTPLGEVSSIDRRVRSINYSPNAYIVRDYSRAKDISTWRKISPRSNTVQLTAIPAQKGPKQFTGTIIQRTATLLSPR